MTYAKIISIGDMSPFGAPVTIETKSSQRIVIMLEEEQCRLFLARMASIIELIDKKVAVG